MTRSSRRDINFFVRNVPPGRAGETAAPKARSSMVERCLYMAEAGGSTPSAPIPSRPWGGRSTIIHAPRGHIVVFS